jgi:UDP-2,4-diacetamido-2,4,6-trideoxy-beta-L-altropyranose hydrolase
MRIVFRADASVHMGTGHIMRCLTLAQALKKMGSLVTFICRLHEGHLVERITSNGFEVFTLEVNQFANYHDDLRSNIQHAHWLGATQELDAQECRPLLHRIKPDWLIVDHYAIDHEWQSALSGCYQKLMVIDDLADRYHIADLLLNPNYGANASDYDNMLLGQCHLLIGPNYALLREEFLQWRSFSLARRQNTELTQLLISLGGVDSDNVTGAILEHIARIDNLHDLKIVVVMGVSALHTNSVKDRSLRMPYCTQVLVDVPNMAELMTYADLAIGAAGGTTLERCCLGLPTIQTAIAFNQQQVAEKLDQNGVVKMIKEPKDLTPLLSTAIEWMPTLSQLSAEVCDGRGCQRVVEHMKSNYKDIKMSNSKLDLEENVAKNISVLVSKFIIEKSYQVTESTPLIGDNTLFDSMKLVSLCLELEDLASHYDFDFDWTSDAAMSRSMSMFRTVGSLTATFLEQMRNSK